MEQLALVGCGQDLSSFRSNNFVKFCIDLAELRRDVLCCV